MDCDEARIHLLDLTRGRLQSPLLAQAEVHLEGCAACRAEAESERALDRILMERLPRHALPGGLRRRLSAMAGQVPGDRGATGRRWIRSAVPALAASILLAAGGVLVGYRSGVDRGAVDSLAGEAVSDHLRLLVSQHPLEIESDGTHVVKPWFEGRVDFAPQVLVPGTGDLRLRGGAVGYFLDRPAAVVSYALRRHAVTLLVFRADGLPWPAGGLRNGEGSLTRASGRGFNVVLWRAGGLGHALVSDVDEAELLALAERLSRG
jgi:anti-sigma factor RsiW